MRRPAILQSPLGSKQQCLRSHKGRGIYSVLMQRKQTPPQMPGVEFLVDGHGRRKSVLIDLETHGELWDDVFDAYLAASRKNEPRESLAAVSSKLTRSSGKRGSRD